MLASENNLLDITRNKKCTNKAIYSQNSEYEKIRANALTDD